MNLCNRHIFKFFQKVLFLMGLYIDFNQLILFFLSKK